MLTVAAPRRYRNREHLRYIAQQASANDLAIRRALEAAGGEFIEENGGGSGVRLKQRTRPKSTK
jgi:hypothetical protein